MPEAGALEAQVSQQVILAMKAHDPVRTTTLRLIKNALKNKFIEKREALTPAEEQQALATMIKQRRDSIEQFTKPSTKPLSPFWSPKPWPKSPPRSEKRPRPKRWARS